MRAGGDTVRTNLTRRCLFPRDELRSVRGLGGGGIGVARGLRSGCGSASTWYSASGLKARRRGWRKQLDLDRHAQTACKVDLDRADGVSCKIVWHRDDAALDADDGDGLEARQFEQDAGSFKLGLECAALRYRDGDRGADVACQRQLLCCGVNRAAIVWTACAECCVVARTARMPRFSS